MQGMPYLCALVRLRLPARAAQRATTILCFARQLPAGDFSMFFQESFYGLLISQSKQLLVFIMILFRRWFFRPIVTSFMLLI